MRQFNIDRPDESMRRAVQEKIDNLNKPRGSLGQLEQVAMQVCLVQHTLSPRLQSPHHLLFGADHGIEREGVSQSPREVTWQQMKNFARGGGGVNMFCRQHGFRLLIVDVGVDHDLSGVEGVIDRKIGWGTRDFLHGPAMTTDEMDMAMAVGVEMVGRCVDRGCNIVSIGEMGIGNTSPSSVWMHLMGGIPLGQCIGAGSGLDHEGIVRKRQVLEQAVKLFRETHGDDYDVAQVVSHFGGFEMVAAIGAMLACAEHGITVVIDGFIMTACALAAVRLCPESRPYMVFAHEGDESGHRLMLGLLDARPLLSLGLRLGEGTGALCAYPLIDSAVRMVNEMNTFDKAHITKYF